MGIHLFSMAIEEQVDIDKLKLFDLFFLPHFNKPYNYITMAALAARYGAVGHGMQGCQIPSCILHYFGVKWESITPGAAQRRAVLPGVKRTGTRCRMQEGDFQWKQ